MNPLKQYLIKHNLSENAFANTHNIPQATIWRVANDKVTPDPATAKKIEQATQGKVTRLELLYREKNLYLKHQSFFYKFKNLLHLK